MCDRHTLPSGYWSGAKPARDGSVGERSEIEKHPFAITADNGDFLIPRHRPDTLTKTAHSHHLTRHGQDRQAIDNRQGGKR